MKDLSNLIGFIIHRNKIVNINMRQTIENNFDSCVSLFRGFFGEPYRNNDNMTCTKDVVDLNQRKLYDVDSFCSRLGFRVYVNKTVRGTWSVVLAPDRDVQGYLTARSFGEEYNNQNELYRRIR